MSEKPEAPRLRLADIFPEEGLGPLAGHSSEAPRQILKATARLACEACGGDVLRSRVRFYERPWVRWSKRRPYRCMECGARQWRAESNPESK